MIYKMHDIMKKGIMMIAAMTMLSMGAAGCKASDKGVTDGGDTAAAVADANGVGAEAENQVDMPQDNVWGDKEAQTTASGLKYRVLQEGEGKRPGGPDALVKVHYEGKHLDGTVFDSSYERGEPVEFPLGRVIKGWTEGVQLMQEGAKYEFLIPSQLAYGHMGTPGGPIKPDEDLYFVVELLEVK